MDREKSGLGNKEKALAALAAAIGAGCRHCADKLHPMAMEAGATGEEACCGGQPESASQTYGPD